MSDATAAVLAAILLAAAVAAYGRRDALQPNRAAAAVYLAGTVAWGAALMFVWAAWAAGTPAKVCADGTCEAIVESLEPGMELTGDLLPGQELLDIAPTE